MFDYTNIRKNYFDKKRDEFLAALYDGNFGEVERVYKDISCNIDTADELSEVDLKAINQIQHAFRRFRRPIAEYLGGDIRENHARVRKSLAKAARAQVKDVKYVEHDAWFKRTVPYHAEDRLHSADNSWL